MSFRLRTRAIAGPHPTRSLDADVPLHLTGHAAETKGGAGQAWTGGGPELLASTGGELAPWPR